MNFADRLKQLPATTHLAALHLLGADGQVIATLENKPGQAGSLAVYAALAALPNFLGVLFPDYSLALLGLGAVMYVATLFVSTRGSTVRRGVSA